MASSSTGEQHRKVFRLPAGWSVPRTLGRLAPALTGTLHPTSTMPSHVFRAGFFAAYRTVELCTSSFMHLKPTFFEGPRTQGRVRGPTLSANLTRADVNRQQHRRLGELTVRHFALYQAAQSPHRQQSEGKPEDWIFG